MSDDDQGISMLRDEMSQIKSWIKATDATIKGFLSRLVDAEERVARAEERGAAAEEKTATRMAWLIMLFITSLGGLVVMMLDVSARSDEKINAIEDKTMEVLIAVHGSSVLMQQHLITAGNVKKEIYHAVEAVEKSLQTSIERTLNAVKDNRSAILNHERAER